jgi:hypothetical protein
LCPVTKRVREIDLKLLHDDLEGELDDEQFEIGVLKNLFNSVPFKLVMKRSLVLTRFIVIIRAITLDSILVLLIILFLFFLLLFFLLALEASNPSQLLVSSQGRWELDLIKLLLLVTFGSLIGLLNI